MEAVVYQHSLIVSALLRALDWMLGNRNVILFTGECSATTHPQITYSDSRFAVSRPRRRYQPHALALHAPSVPPASNYSFSIFSRPKLRLLHRLYRVGIESFRLYYVLRLIGERKQRKLKWNRCKLDWLALEAWGNPKANERNPKSHAKCRMHSVFNRTDAQLISGSVIIQISVRNVTRT